MLRIFLKKAVSVFLVFLFIFCAFPFFRLNYAGAATYKAYGIDVSKWNGNVDYSKVKAAGIDFVVIRVGYSKTMDPYFETNYKNAKAAGLNVGVYFYTYSSDIAGAAEDAATVISWLKGKQLEYPVYYDMEDDKQKNLTQAVRTSMCETFCDALLKAGYYPGVYSGKSWFNTYIDRDALSKKYSIWEAWWPSSGTDSSDRSAYCDIWQYYDKGSISGISGNVDLDVSYVDYPSFIKKNGYNGFGGGGLSPSVDTVRGYYKVTASALNMREGPGTSNAVLSTIPGGTTIPVLKKDDGSSWVQVVYDDRTGWVNSGYLSFVKYFSYSFEYDVQMSGVSVPETGIFMEGNTVVCAVDGISCKGYVFDGWYLKRSSDGAWYKSDGTWSTSASETERYVFLPGAELILDMTYINGLAGDDAFVLTGKWSKEEVPVTMRGYYTVSVKSGNLNMRSGDGTSYSIIASVPKDATVAVIGENADRSWVRVIYGDKIGWVSASYLTLIRYYEYTVSYESSPGSVSDIQSAVYSYGKTVSVSERVLSAPGYVFGGWNLKRSSDGAWLTQDGEWKEDTSDRKLFLSGDEFTFDKSVINEYAGDDTFVLSAVWTKEVSPILFGDVDGNGKISVADSLLLKRFISGKARVDEIIFENTDVNCDGIITSADSALLKLIFESKSE